MKFTRQSILYRFGFPCTLQIYTASVEATRKTTLYKLHKVSNGILCLPGSVLTRIAPWDILGDALPSFIGYYEVVQGIGLILLPKGNL